MTPEEIIIADEIFKYVGGQPCEEHCECCELLRKRLLEKFSSLGIGLNRNGVFIPFSEK